MKLRRDLKHLEAYYQIYMKVSIGSKIVEGPWEAATYLLKI